MVPPGLGRSETVVELRNVSRVYGRGPGRTYALRDVSVAFARSSFSAIMGPSGSGKSTLMQCAAGLDSPTSGTIFLDDIDLTGLKEPDLTITRRQGVGFVFQAFNLVPTLDARQNILLPSRLANRAVDPRWFEQVIDSIGIREHLRKRPAQLSGGQQQRIAIGRALVNRPQVVFADEPTGALDTRTGNDVLALLRRTVDNFGQTVVMVTHDPKAAAIADHVVFLADGRIIDELSRPSADAIAARMTRLESPDAGTHA